ncbi:MAG: UPF0149 family protein [Dokdonella sp.]
MTDEISHGDLDHSIAVAQLGVDASDLHGSLTGFLCAGGKTTPQRWLADLALDDELVGEEADVFEQLHADVTAALEDHALIFEPLLPYDRAPLAERAEALVAWCRGFLGGIGLADATDRIATLDDDGQEMLRDLGHIAASRLEFEGGEGDEQSLAELIEYVRVAVLSLHAEFNRPSAASIRTVH